MYVVLELVGQFIFPVLISMIVVSTIYISIKVINILNVILALSSIFIIFYLITKNKFVSKNVIYLYLVIYTIITIDLIIMGGL